MNLKIEEYHKRIENHVLFRGLKFKNKNKLHHYYSIKEFPQGYILQKEGEGSDQFLILLEGEISSRGEEGDYQTLFKGDYFGLSTLFRDDLSQKTYRAEEKSICICFTRDGLDNFINNNPLVLNQLSPQRGQGDEFISGFPLSFWENYNQEKKKERSDEIIYYKGKKSRKNFSLNMVFILFIIGLLFCLPSSVMRYTFQLLLFVIFSFCFLIRQFEGYKITDKGVTRRFFNYRIFHKEVENIPLDQIRSVSISVKGLRNKLLNIGTLSIQRGNRALLFENIDNPLEVQNLIRELQQLKDKESKNNEKEALKRSVYRNFCAEKGEQTLYIGACSTGLKERVSKILIFRKSIFFLLIKEIPLFLLFSLFLILSFNNQIFTTGFPLFLIPSILVFLILIWIYIEWVNDIYKVDESYLWSIKKDILKQSDIRNQTALNAISDIKTSQKGLLALVFNYGDVIIEVLGSSKPCILEKVSYPLSIQKKLFAYREAHALEQKKQISLENQKRMFELTTMIEEVREEYGYGVFKMEKQNDEIKEK